MIAITDFKSFQSMKKWMLAEADEPSSVLVLQQNQVPKWHLGIFGAI